MHLVPEDPKKYRTQYSIVNLKDLNDAELLEQKVADMFEYVKEQPKIPSLKKLSHKEVVKSNLTVPYWAADWIDVDVTVNGYIF